MKNTYFLLLALIIAIPVSVFSQSDTTFKSKGNLIIQVFGNFDYNATQEAQKKYAFWIGRAHLGYQYQYTKQLSGKIIIDAGRSSTFGNISVADSLGNNMNVTNSSREGSYYTMILKLASIEWKPNEHFVFQAGAILQNHYITQEKFWGFRYVLPTFQDRYYSIPSSDLGFIAFYKINEKIGLDLALTNGEGFRFDQDNYGDLKLAGGLDFVPIKGLQTRLFYDYTKSENPLKPSEQQLFSAFVGYKEKDRFRIGAEYNYRKNHLNINQHNFYGYSVFGSITIFKKTELFARYDNLQANNLQGETENWNYQNTGQAFITGLQFNPTSGINISLNYQGWKPESNSKVFQNHILVCFEYKL